LNDQVVAYNREVCPAVGNCFEWRYYRSRAIDG